MALLKVKSKKESLEFPSLEGQGVGFKITND
jgi:hypothetical protein